MSRLLALLPFVALLACESGPPAPSVGQQFERPDGTLTVTIADAGRCEAVRGRSDGTAAEARQRGIEKAERFAGIGIGAGADTTYPTRVRDRTAQADRDCVAFVVESSVDASGASIYGVPEEVVVMERGSFERAFRPVE